MRFTGELADPTWLTEDENMESWLEIRQQQLMSSLGEIREKQKITIVQPYCLIDEKLSDIEVHYASDNIFDNPSFRCDVFFGQGNSIDTGKLVKVRKTNRACIEASWFWDNHHSIAETVKIALLTDIYFPGHLYKSGYINNECSLDGGFIPMCPMQWTRADVENAASMSLREPRSDRLYGGYNAYPEFPHRDVLIEKVRSAIPCNNLFITPSGTSYDKHPFISKSPTDRLIEYMQHKVVLCISIDQDLTMRTFDALLAGCIPLIVKKPADLDLVIGPELQESLPVLFTESDDPEQIASAYRLCLDRFNAEGFAGVARRHSFVLNNHMPKHRIERMVNSIRLLAERVGKRSDPDSSLYVKQTEYGRRKDMIELEPKPSEKHVQRSFSQEGEDMLLSKLFNYRSHGFYVDVGAHDPYRFSNTYALHERGWKGINIDATPGVKEAFDLARPGDINLSYFVSDKSNVSVDFDIYTEPALNSGVAGRREGFSDYFSKTITIKTARLDEILNEFLPNGQEIDVLTVDVEGVDLQVLRSNNWDIYRPKVVLTECYFNIQQMLEEPVVSYMNEIGYELRSYLYSTAFFIQKGSERYHL